MFKRFFYLACLSFFISASVVNAIDPLLIPQPRKVVDGFGVFTLDSTTNVLFPEQFKTEVAVFNEYLIKRYGFKVKANASRSSGKKITISISNKLSAEEYQLDIEAASISIIVAEGSGVQYAFETLKQLLPAGKTYPLSIAASKIEDSPRFTYRGMHLDVARHFFTKDVVKQYLDWMAMYKFNTFHWHLTDDQGWRVEIKKYPLLTSVGAYRNGTLIGHYGGNPERYDTLHYGGFYTQDDIREIIKYAADRHITIIPEIEMPGHALAALAAYPSYACTPGPFQVGRTWGVFNDIFCPNDETFSFLQDILTEVCDLFPGKYVHIGGDEAPKDRWKSSPFCQELIRKENLKDEEDLQRLFTNRIITFLKSKNKIGIGWDEILSEGLDSSAVVMSWRGVQGGKDAAVKGHDVIMSPGEFCYFDAYQSRSTGGKVAIGGYLPIQKVYAFDPQPDGLSIEHARHILGAQANVWTEYIGDTVRLQEMIFPRMAALAEVLWTAKDNRSFDSFSARLYNHFKFLKFNNINYSKAIYEVIAHSYPNGNKGILVQLTSAVPRVQIKYAFAPGDLTKNTSVYTAKIPLTKTAFIRTAAFEGERQLGDELKQFVKFNKATGKSISLETKPDSMYNSGGAFSLVNGLIGRIPWLDSDWLGFRNQNIVANLDLGEETFVSRVSLDMLKDESSWIYYPDSIHVLISADGKKYTEAAAIGNKMISNYDRIMDVPFTARTRYIKIIITPAKGKDAWLFIDEIGVD